MARLSFRCSEDLVARVDVARGDVARERWLRRAVEQALGGAGARRGAVAAAEAIVAQPERYGESTVETARKVLADKSYREFAAPVERPAVRSHAPNCKCPVCS